MPSLPMPPRPLRLVLFLLVLASFSTHTVGAQHVIRPLPMLRLSADARATLQDCEGGEAVQIGQTLHFQSAVGNASETTFTGVLLTLSVTDELQFLPGTESSSKGSWTVQPQQAQLNIGTLGPGETITWAIDLQAVAGGQATFMEVLTTAEGASAEASCTINVEAGQPNLTATKTATAGPEIAVNTEFDYVIVVSNTGTAPASDVLLKDTLPATVDIVRVDDPPPALCLFVDATHELTCGLGTIDPGASVTVRVTVVAAEAGDATNTAFVEGLPASVELTIIPDEEPVFQVPGRKFFDLDEDGLRDPGEPGINGVTIELLDENGGFIDDVVTASRDLDGDGRIDLATERGLFTFADVPRGTYTLREVIPFLMGQTAPGGDGTYRFTLDDEAPETDFLFGNTLLFDRVDFGDLPDPRAGVTCPAGFDCYPTVLGSLPAFHVIVPEAPFLGIDIDDDLDGQPDDMAQGDDALDGNDDEDGLLSVTVLPDGALRFEIFVTDVAGGGAFIDAWIDLNDDGDLDPGVLVGSDEYVLNRVPVVHGLNTLTTNPGLFDPGDVIGYSRFRLSSAGGLLPDGGAEDGEVEDYFMLGTDFGDAREDNLEDFPDFPQGYPVVLASDGARHLVTPTVRLGERTDADAMGARPTILASGDDKAAEADEDGITFTRGFFEQTIELDEAVPDPAAGRPFTFYAMARSTTVELVPLPSVDGRLDAWVDFNRDGDWDDEGEQVFASETIQPVSGAPTDTLRFDVPDDADAGFTYARFRFSRNGNLKPMGAAPDGEVEDYLLQVLSAVTQVQVINAVLPGARAGGKQDATFDLYIGGTRVADDLATGAATAFLTLPLSDAAPTVEIVSGEVPDNSAPLFASEVDFAAEGTTVADANTLVLTGTEDGTLGLLLKKEARRTAADGNKVEFFIAHAAPDEPALDVRRFNDAAAPLVDDLAFGEATGYLSLDPGSYTFEVTTGDGSTQLDVFRLDLSARAGESLVLVLTGRRSDGSFALVLFDAASQRIEPEVVTATETAGEVPAAFALHANYPNPFNPQTTIRFDVMDAVPVRLQVFNVLGQVVATLVDEALVPGRYEVVFEAHGLPSGVYFYRLEVAAFTNIRRMVLAK